MAKEKQTEEFVAASISHSEDGSFDPFDSDKLDAAGRFLQEHGDLDTSDVDITKLRHKIDRWILPLMCACFIMQFLDKAIYNYTSLMGIKKDLHFGPSSFSDIASAYAVAHLVMQIPNTFILQKLPAAKWLVACILGWGICTLATAAVRDAPGMLVVRVFLALTEATIGPSLMLITSQWYRKNEQAPRFALWHAAPGFGMMFGGLLSYGFQHVPKNFPLAGWRLMFILLGVITLLVGVLCYWWLPDTPMNARFLTTKEKVAILRHVSINMTGVENHKFEPAQLLEALRDPQIYLFTLLAICASMTSGLAGTYSTTLIKDLGYSGKQSALLNMPMGVATIVFNVLLGFGIRRTSSRWAWGMSMCVPGIIGASLLAFLRQPNKAGSLAGMYMVVGIVSTSTIYQQWAVANVSGHTKRPLISSILTAGVGLAGILSPQTFREKDKAGGYLPAKITVLVSQAATAALFFAMFQYYLWENKRRNAKSHQHGVAETVADDTTVDSADAWSGMTDIQNWRKFRYVY